MVPPMPTASLSSPPQPRTRLIVSRPSVVSDGLTRLSKNDLSQIRLGSRSCADLLSDTAGWRWGAILQSMDVDSSA